MRLFRTLRARLLISYAFVLLFTLAVTGVTLLIVLRSRNSPTEDVSQRLATTLLSFQSRPEIITIAPSGVDRRLEVRLNVWARTARFRGFAVRLIVYNQDNKISYDSTSVFVSGSTFNPIAQSYDPPDFVDEGNTFSADTAWTRGNFHNPDGTEWQYVGALLDPKLSNGWWYMIAVPAPRQLTLGETIQYFGDDMMLSILQAGVIGLIVAFVLSLFITRQVTRPLQQVAAAASAMAQGDLEQKVPVSGPLETRTVAESFNVMATEVSATQKSQREFLANVTHDLRTPLTSIQGFSQAIMDGVASNPASAQRAAQIIHDEAGRMNRMVEELLDLARIEAGRFQMTRHTVQMDDILSNLAERLTLKAKEKGVLLNAELMPLPPIAGDADRLVQVFTNLVDNAIKHTPEGGSVILRATLQDFGVLVRIIDTGEGIPPEDLPHVFDRFYQVDKSRQRAARMGAGLGLAITRQIVDAHGGKIWAESAEGKGSTFSVWLPAPASDATTIIRRRSSATPRR